MSLREFRKAGHPPTLAAAFLYFDVSFMVWVLLGPLAPFLAESLKLTATQKGVLTAVPLLGGSFFRPILGWMTERFGGRRTGLIGLGVSLIPLAIGWQFASAVRAIPRARPAARRRRRQLRRSAAAGQRLVSARNTRASPWASPARAIPAPCWPRCSLPAWRSRSAGTPSSASPCCPCALVWIAFFLMAKDAPGVRVAKTWKDYSAPSQGNRLVVVLLPLQHYLRRLRRSRQLSLRLLPRSVSRQQGAGRRFHHLRRPVRQLPAPGRRHAGRPLGRLSHAPRPARPGSPSVSREWRRLPPAIAALALLAGAMAMMGMGNGSVFQLVPQRFAGRVGIMTGIVGAAGGFGGFLLPSALGAIKDRTGTFGLGFALLAFVAISGAAALLALGRVWRSPLGARIRPPRRPFRPYRGTRKRK